MSQCPLPGLSLWRGRLKQDNFLRPLVQISDCETASMQDSLLKFKIANLLNRIQNPGIPNRFECSVIALDMVTKAQHWIYANFQNKIDFQQLSNHLAVSYRTFIRRFKFATGETPSKYLQKLRIEASKDLLETTNLNLETIMESVGYSDTSSFSLLFKRLTCLTPKEYRNRFSMDQIIKH